SARQRRIRRLPGRGQVGLGGNQEGWPRAPDQRVVLIAERLGAVQELKDQVRGCGLSQGPIDPRTLDRVVRVSHSRGIDQFDRPSIEGREGGYKISRRARGGS